MQLDANDLKSLFSSTQTHSFEIGKCYLIRTVTMYFTGRCIRVTDSDVLLEDACLLYTSDAADDDYTV